MAMIAGRAELQCRFGELFEAEVAVFPVSTGTAANALALAALSPPWGAVYCSRHAHVETSEANAAAFFGGGLKLALLDGEHGKVSAEALEAAIVAAGIGLKHRSQPAALSLTQATELGTVYSLDELGVLAEIARRHGLRIHMDGARLANALARFGCAPAELIRKSGVDILSFGATKNGGLLCDAIVVFDHIIAERLAYQLRRSGQTWSKMRFAAAQLIAYVEDGLWLRNAAKANAIAVRIAAGLAAMPGIRPLAPIETNEIFLDLDTGVMDAIEADGIAFFRRNAYCSLRLPVRCPRGRRRSVAAIACEVNLAGEVE
jgi:threonine aldolase